MEQENSILEYLRSHYFGKFRGKVSENNDPTRRGRLKVTVEAFPGHEWWALPCVPYAGKNVGFFSLPPIGASVWIEFEGGDLSFAIWTGCFWADGELPDVVSGPEIKLWKTESLTIRLDDSADELLIQNTSESKTTFGEAVKTESGDATLTVGDTGGTSVNINDGAFEVT